MGQRQSKAASAAPLVQPSLSGDLAEVKRLVGRHLATLDPSGSPSSSTSSDPRLAEYASRSDPQGNTALHAAACGGHGAVLAFLADRCGSGGKETPLLTRNGMGCTPLWLAAGYGHSDLLADLLRRAGEVVSSSSSSTSSSSSSSTATATATATLPQEVVLCPNGRGDTSLLAAASRGHVGCCRLLLEALDRGGGRGAAGGLAQANEAGDTPLSVAVGSGTAPLDLLSLLLGERDGDGAGGGSGPGPGPGPGPVPPERRANSSGLTPLLVACERNFAGAAKLLLELDPSLLGQRDPGGRTPLAVAAFCGCDDVAEVLLGTGGGRTSLDDPGDVGRGGRPPLWLAARTGNAGMVRRLLDAGADPTVKCGEDGLTAEEVAVKYGKTKVMEVFGHDVREVEVGEEGGGC